MLLSRTHKNRIALAAICLASLMFGLEISSVPVILPTLETVLEGDFKDLQWIMNAYTIACTSVLMATGTLADRFGRKRVFVISITAFGTASLLCGLATSTQALIAARALQGMAGGAMLICLVAILSHQFQEGRDRARAFGAWGIVSGIGLGFGPLIGGAIVALSNWQWVFLVHGPLAIAALALAFCGVEESRDPQAKRLDIAGILTLSLTILGLTYFITQGPTLGFASAAAAGILAVTAGSLIAFVVVERGNPHPMFDFSVFKIRNFSGALFGSMGMNFGYWPFMIYLPIYFQSGLGYGSLVAGLCLLAYTLPSLVFPPLGERLALRYRPNVVIPAGLFAIGSGFMLMKYGSGIEQASGWTLLPGSLLAGTGLGIINTPVTNTVTGSISRTRAGMASGMDISARMISLAINIAVMGFILVAGIAAHLASAFPGAFDETQLLSLAESIAAGKVAAPLLDYSSLDNPPSLAAGRAALVSGFGWVMLYAGISTWILAMLSFATFRPSRLACRAIA